MRISTFFYTLKQGIINIFRNKWFSLASVATISACLFLFGLFYAVIANFQSIVKTAEEGVSVTIFFQPGTTEEQMQEIGSKIEAREEVSKVEFTSADEAWDYYRENWIPEEFSDGFPDNPLENSASYAIYMKDIAEQSALVDYLNTIPEIKTVNQSELAATTLTGVNALVAYVSAGIILILLLVSVFLISNTVTIGISVRKEEISIMKYIGATDFFVRAPFVIEGILIGILGSAFPLGTIYVLYNKVVDYIGTKFSVLSNLLHFLPVNTIFTTLAPVIVIVGVGIGFMGSFITVRKHLRV
ncbi:permease-like cell division protein FtsX [Eisenbergiella porci]|uniref:permease-like cell division protein FtsX n=1 Tax=Eisenbergiella porci TaxID=2652274 RepID=UPI002A834164|nr:permease-like cell division protein FtsX [Eisenbergiella porci]